MICPANALGIGLFYIASKVPAGQRCGSVDVTVGKKPSSEEVTCATVLLKAAVVPRIEKPRRE